MIVKGAILLYFKKSTGLFYENMRIRDFSDYFFHSLSRGTDEVLQVSSVCNASCFYCNHKQNPFSIKRVHFRDIREIEKVLWSIDEIKGGISLNDTSRFIANGEPLLHPEIFKIFELIRRRFNSPIRLVTNGSLLTEETVKEMAKYKPVKVDFSLHTVTKEYWKKAFGLGDKEFYTAKKGLFLLREYGIDISFKIVVMPAFFGYDDLEKTIDFLTREDLCRDVIHVNNAGYTKYAKKEDVKRMVCDKQELSKFFRKMEERYGIRINWVMDPGKKVPVNEKEFMSVAEKLREKDVRESYLFTSVAAFEAVREKIDEITEELPIKINVVPVENRFYGGNIECAGLLTIDDIRKKIDEMGLEGQVIVLPNIFLDKYGYDLREENITDFIRESNNMITVANKHNPKDGSCLSPSLSINHSDK